MDELSALIVSSKLVKLSRTHLQALGCWSDRVQKDVLSSLLVVLGQLELDLERQSLGVQLSLPQASHQQHLDQLDLREHFDFRPQWPQACLSPLQVTCLSHFHPKELWQDCSCDHLKRALLPHAMNPRDWCGKRKTEPRQRQKQVTTPKEDELT